MGGNRSNCNKLTGRTCKHHTARPGSKQTHVTCHLIYLQVAYNPRATATIHFFYKCVTSADRNTFYKTNSAKFNKIFCFSNEVSNYPDIANKILFYIYCQVTLIFQLRATNRTCTETPGKKPKLPVYFLLLTACRRRHTLSFLYSLSLGPRHQSPSENKGHDKSYHCIAVKVNHDKYSQSRTSWTLQSGPDLFSPDGDPQIHLPGKTVWEL